MVAAHEGSLRRGKKFDPLSSRRCEEEILRRTLGSDAERAQRQASRPRRKREERHKSEGGLLSRTSTTQLNLHLYLHLHLHPRLHRHGQVEPFRCCPLRCHRARRCHRSVLPFSVVPRRRRLTRDIGKRAPLGSDHLVTRDSNTDDGLIDALIIADVDVDLRRAPHGSDHVARDSNTDDGLIDALIIADVDVNLKRSPHGSDHVARDSNTDDGLIDALIIADVDVNLKRSPYDSDSQGGSGGGGDSGQGGSGGDDDSDDDDDLLDLDVILGLDLDL